MRWLALHLPRLSLEAGCAALPAAERARPVVLLHGHRVAHLNAEATARGVQVGQRRATALALAGDLLIVEADPRRDAAAVQAVGHTALGYTPAVTTQDAATVLLEVQASLRLFRGLPTLWRGLLQRLQPLGLSVASASAPTALGAALLARAAAAGAAAAAPPAPDGQPWPGPHAADARELRQQLDALPLGLLDEAAAQAERLEGLGLRRLGELRALPREGLARRVGPGLLDALDRALGASPDPRRWLTLPAVYEARLELHHRAESAEQVLVAAATLLARLVAWAQARQHRIAAFTLALRHERQRQQLHPPTVLRVELAEPALEAEHLQLLLRERLARVELAAPTLELDLHCADTVAAPAPNGELFPTRASQAEGLTRLLERLRARLGDARVQRLLPVADHRPERSCRALPAQEALPSGAAAVPLAIATGPSPLPHHRPAWLLPEPLPLATRGAEPLLDGQPLLLLSGPERIEAGWWDAAAVARDYFIAQTGEGALVWVYRGRIPADTGEPDWYLQGRFA